MYLGWVVLYWLWDSCHISDRLFSQRRLTSVNWGVGSVPVLSMYCNIRFFSPSAVERRRGSALDLLTFVDRAEGREGGCLYFGFSLAGDGRYEG